MSERPSTELAIPSTQLLCENVISRIGVDRSLNGVRIDADWESTDIDGQEHKLRLIQQSGVGRQAIYTLRVEDSLSNGRSVYRFDVSRDQLVQTTHKEDGSMTQPFEWDPSQINELLYTDTN